MELLIFTRVTSFFVIVTSYLSVLLDPLHGPLVTSYLSMLLYPLPLSRSTCHLIPVKPVNVTLSIALVAVHLSLYTCQCYFTHCLSHDPLVTSYLSNLSMLLYPLPLSRSTCHLIPVNVTLSIARSTCHSIPVNVTLSIAFVTVHLSLHTCQCSFIQCLCQGPRVTSYLSMLLYPLHGPLVTPYLSMVLYPLPLSRSTCHFIPVIPVNVTLSNAFVTVHLSPHTCQCYFIHCLSHGPLVTSYLSMLL